MSKGEPAVVKATVKATARIDWRKLLVPSLFIMVLPTISAIVLDKWIGTFPYITIVAIIICFPTATFLVMRIALQEMDRVIDEVAPLLPPEATEAEELPDAGTELTSSP